MTSALFCRPRPLSFVVISFLAVMLVYDSILAFAIVFNCEPTTTFHSFRLRKGSTNRAIRQPHRDKYEITRDILLRLSYAKTTGRHMDKRTIASATGLSHGMTYKYLRILVDQGLLRISQDSGPFRHYEIAEKGLRFLQVFAEIEDDLMPSMKGPG